MSLSTPNNFSQEVFRAITNVTGLGRVPLHEPSFEANELKYLSDCIASTYISSVGRYVDLFASKICSLTGAKYAIPTVSGTSALHLALKCAGINPGDEVLIPSLTFIATANAVSYCNAIPHFVDSEGETLGIDAFKLRKYLEKISVQESSKCINKITRNTIKAIVPMHTFGHSSNLSEIMKIARDFNLIVIEDAAESIGSLYKGQHTGTFGKVGVLSFNGNKTITTGGGGAILTNDESIANSARNLAATAKKQHLWKFTHDEIGYNYRMPSLNAAVGCAQLESLSKKLDLKKKLFLKYKESFEGLEGARIFEAPSNSTSNYWLQTVILDDDFTRYRDDILDFTNQRGLTTRPAWDLISEQKPYANHPRMNLDGAEALQKKIINIPSSPKLGNVV